MRKPAIVTGSDSGYFPLVLGCLLSVMDRCSDRFEYFVLDCGLSVSDRHIAAQVGAVVIAPDWDLRVDMAEPPEQYKALVCRAFLPKYCGDDRTIIWLDADAWVQNPSYLDVLIRGSEIAHYCGVVELDAQYIISPPLRRLSNLQNWYDVNLGYEESVRLYQLPVINNGVFAMHGSSPCWKAWQGLFAKAVSRTSELRRYISDQLTLNSAVYRKGITSSILPASYNWCVHLGQVCWSGTHLDWRARALPNLEIGILHMSGIGNRYSEVRWPRMDGGSTVRTLLYRNGDYLSEYGLRGVIRADATV